jgi:hypothetical protein
MNQVLPALLPVIVELLEASLEIHEAQSVQCEGDGDTGYDSDGTTLGLESCIIEMLDLVNALVTMPRFRTALASFLEQITCVVVGFLQMTEKQMESWADDLNQYVADEDEESFEYSVRLSSRHALHEISNEFSEAGQKAVISAASQNMHEASALQQFGAAHWWKRREAALVALAIAVGDDDDEGARISMFDAPALLQELLSTDLVDANSHPFLYGQALVTASKMVSVGINAENLGVAAPFLEASSACWCERRHTSSALRCNPCGRRRTRGATTAAEPQLTPVLLQVWGANIHDPLITQDILETLETMATQSPACAAGLCNTLVPHVCHMISNSRSLPEGALESAIDLVTMLIQTGAGNFSSIPNLVHIFAMVTSLGGADGVDLCSADHSVLQNVAECTRAFVEAMPEATVEVEVADGVTGLRRCVAVVSYLSSPDLSDPAAMEVGPLITSLIRRCGHLLDSLVVEILGAVVCRLRAASMPSLIQNLLLVLAHVVNRQGGATFIEFLCACEPGTQPCTMS